MNSSNELQPLWQMLITAIVIFCVHFGILYAFQQAWSVPMISFGTIYLFFTVCSSVIILSMLITKKRNKDAVGYAFLLATSLQLALSYFMIRASLNSPEIDVTDKLNLGFVFGAFLLAETFIGMKVVNSVK